MEPASGVTMTCYPAIVVIGQLIHQFVTGKSDPDRTAVAITQTGGMCRATNYAGLLRKGLRDAGYPQVPVIAVSVQGLEDNPGFKITLPMLHQIIQGITVGDLLQKVLLRTRPYQIDGNVTRLYEKWDRVVQEFFEFKGYSPTLGRKIGFNALLKQIVEEFDAVELQDIPRKPRVGMVGEILVQYHPAPTNYAVGTIERIAAATAWRVLPQGTPRTGSTRTSATSATLTASSQPGSGQCSSTKTDAPRLEIETIRTRTAFRAERCRKSLT